MREMQEWPLKTAPFPKVGWPRECTRTAPDGVLMKYTILKGRQLSRVAMWRRQTGWRTSAPASCQRVWPRRASGGYGPQFLDRKSENRCNLSVCHRVMTEDSNGQASLLSAQPPKCSGARLAPFREGPLPQAISRLAGWTHLPCKSSRAKY